LYEKLLRESGIKTKIDMLVMTCQHSGFTNNANTSYSGVPHGFISLPIKARTKHREDIQTAIHWILNRGA
jgi:hypothetical protein